MSEKRPSAKHKIDRRMGENIWGRAKSPLNRRAYPPGQHGPLARKKLTDYGRQLFAKQKLKGYYGNIGEKRFRKYYQEAARRRGDTGQILVELLERRLDAVCYRMKFAPTVFAARQLVNHGHVKVNGRRLNVGSYSVKDGDIIEIREKSRELQIVLEGVNNNEREVPEYLEVDAKALKGTFLRGPGLSDIPYPVQMEPNLVVEFYSR